MLEIEVALEEAFDEETSTFVKSKAYKVRLEHSLVTVSKWESVWEKAFLGKQEKTQEEVLSYLRIMLVDEIPPEVFRKLIEKHLEEIQTYIQAPMTATKVPDGNDQRQSRETVTSELIYYWMISMGIPVEFERWHLSRLLMLIRVINFKNQPKKNKMTAQQRRALNKQRREQYNTRG